VTAVGVVDDQFAALVFRRVGQEQRRGEIGADEVCAARHRAHGAVDVIAVGLAIFVTIE